MRWEEYVNRYPDAGRITSASVDKAWRDLEDAAAMAAGYRSAGMVPRHELPGVVSKFLRDGSPEARRLYAAHREALDAEVKRAEVRQRVAQPNPTDGAPTDAELAEARKHIKRLTDAKRGT